MPLWHERDISHSGSERIILPDAFGLLDYALHILSGVIEGLKVKPDRMLENINLTNGLVFSSKALNYLIESGLPRQEAYSIVQTVAMKSHHERVDFRTLMELDETFRTQLSPEAINEIFDPRSYLVHIDETFRRIGLI